MFKYGSKIIAWAIVITTLPLTLLAQSNKMSGELGIDLLNYKYVSDIKNSPLSYSINRIRSGHYLGLSLAGPLGNSHFANYSSRVKMSGIYFDSKTDNSNSSSYVNPQLSTFYGQATFLPEKPYPLKLYVSKSKDYPLKYEASNRTDRQRLQPELSIVRRYQGDRSSVGGMLQITPSDKISIMSELKQEKSESNRIYDFGEQLDIWVDFIGFDASLGDTAFMTTIKNDLPDSVIFIATYLDTLLDLSVDTIIIIDTIAPGMNAFTQLFLGDNRIEFQAPNFNSYSDIYTVNQTLLITATFRDPAVPNDTKQETNSFTTVVKLGGEGKLTSQSYFEINNQKEAIQKQTTSLTNFSNDLKYLHSRELSTGMLTTYSKNESEVGIISSQTATAMSHQTTVNYQKRRGLSAAFMHSIAHNTSEVGQQTLISDMNLLSSRISYPFKKYRYEVEMKSNAILNSDNTDYVNNQYSTEFINKAEFQLAGITSQPRHEFKYATNTQKNPDQQSQEIETKFKLDNKFYSKLAGELQIKTSYSFRNRWNKKSSDTKNRYIFQVMIIKKLGKAYRLSFMSNNEWEMYGGWIDAGGTKLEVDKPTEKKDNYKFDIQAVLSDNLTLGVNMMIIVQGATSIKKYGFSMIANVPKINLPIKSFVLAETRDLEGLDRQTQFSIETKTNYRIRQINLVLKHVYRKETQLFEKYSINEIRGTIYRNFDVY